MSQEYFIQKLLRLLRSGFVMLVNPGLNPVTNTLLMMSTNMDPKLNHNAKRLILLILFLVLLFSMVFKFIKLKKNNMIPVTTYLDKLNQ